MAQDHGHMPSLANLTVMQRLKVSTSIKVVVLCHPRSFEGHWQEAVIRARTSELYADEIKDGKTLDFFTLDGGSGSTADFPAGGAQTLFQETKFCKTPRFDMIWAPDCGGEWFEMMEMQGDAQLKRFVELTRTMSRCLKAGGFIMMGKLPFGDDATLNEAVRRLHNAGFARAEFAPVPDPYGGNKMLEYIMVQTAA
jgi:hypothetical protein